MLVVVALPAAAAAYCPQRADDLAAFARCMAPLRGAIGTTSVVVNANYDRDHQQLMSAMANQAVVPPQVMPTSPTPYYSVVPYSSGYGFNPYASVLGATAAVYGASPAFWYVYSMYRPF